MARKREGRRRARLGWVSVGGRGGREEAGRRRRRRQRLRYASGEATLRFSPKMAGEGLFMAPPSRDCVRPAPP